MKRRAIGLLCAVLVASICATGCAINRATATVDPTAQLDKLHTLQVKQLEGEDGTVRKLISSGLRTRGYKVTENSQAPESADAVVTYTDKWMWDITMYLVELNITIRDPKTDYPLAVGNSLHTSLTRKSAPEMVNEVLGNIFKKSGEEQ